MIKKYFVIIFLLFIFIDCSQGQRSELLEDFKTRVAEAKLTMNRSVLDTISLELIALGELENSKEILQYGNYIRADALSRKIPSRAIYHAKMAQSYYAEVDDKFLWSRVTNVLANAHSNKGEHRKAIGTYVSILNILDEMDGSDSPESQRYKSRVAYNAGFVSIKLGDIDNAIRHLSDAYEVAISGRDTLLEFSILNQFGNVNFYKNDFPQALKYYKESYALANQYSPRLAAVPMFGIGGAYQEMGILDSALVYNLKSMNWHRKTGNKASLCVALFNCSELHIELKQYDEAIVYSEELMELGLQMDAKQHILNAANTLGRGYYESGNPKLAGRVMSQYEKYIDDDAEFLMAYKYYEMASIIAEAQGQYQKAFSYHRKYKAYSDSLLNQQTLEKVEELNLKLESKQKDQKIADLQNINTIQKITNQRNIVSVGALLALLVLLASITYLYMNRRRLKIENQKDKIEQKLLRSQMNPHFIFNAISSIQNYLYDKKDLKIALTYMSQFGELMRQILENSREEYVSLAEEIKTLKNYLELQQLRYNNSFGYAFIIDEDIDPEMFMVPPLIVQPFVENSIEHGMIYRIENGLVKIKFASNSDKLEISIEDNGVGARSIEVQSKLLEQEKKSLATVITRERLDYLSKLNKRNFHLAVRSLQEGGSQIIIQLPIVSTA